MCYRNQDNLCHGELLMVATGMVGDKCKKNKNTCPYQYRCISTFNFIVTKENYSIMFNCKYQIAFSSELRILSWSCSIKKYKFPKTIIERNMWEQQRGILTTLSFGTVGLSSPFHASFFSWLASLLLYWTK